MTVLVTCCRASSRKRASAVCWEEALSVMVVGGRDRAERSLKWKGKLTRKIESENERGKNRSKMREKRVDKWWKSEGEFQTLERSILATQEHLKASNTVYNRNQ